MCYIASFISNIIPLVEYIEEETLVLDVHYRKWNYDGPTAEIFLQPKKRVNTIRNVIVSKYERFKFRMIIWGRLSAYASCFLASCWMRQP